MTPHFALMLCAGLLAVACGDGDRPGPASGGAGGAGTGGLGGAGAQDSGPGCLDDWTLADGTACGTPKFCIAGVGCGIRCLDDHTMQQVGATFSCGGHWCIVGEGCHSTCKDNKDCRPEFECDAFQKQCAPTNE
ncbi:MAG: hypothetical protein IT377_26290 [Polyangiaceae bacterium]|nr:hypothetical protein [Polyangiaceae bacterium]